MIRVVVGTVAVLAGFVVLERSVDASTGRAGSCRATQAYVLAQAGDGVAVRAEPSPRAAAIGMVQGLRAGVPEARPTTVTLTGTHGGWARIMLPGDRRSEDIRPGQPHGWVPADMLMVHARVDGTTIAYDRPGLLGHALATIGNGDTKFRVLACRGEWLQVINARHGNVWIDRWCSGDEGCRSRALGGDGSASGRT